MQHSEGSFTGAHGANIYYQSWAPDDDPRALIFIAHGAAEHGGRYDIFAEHFVGKGYLVAALDHFGHGKSDGGRCCLKRLDDHVTNLETFRARVASSFPGLPQILLGHSMGGLIACVYLLQHQDKLAACVLSGPAIKTELVPPWHQVILLKLQSFFSPDSGAMQLDARGVSRIPEEVERYRNDPLNYTGMLTARMVAELFRGMKRVQQHVGEIRLPVLLVHGGADQMTSPSGSKFLYEQVGSEEKGLHIYPGAYHEVFNEPEREQAFADIGGWLSSQSV